MSETLITLPRAGGLGGANIRPGEYLAGGGRRACICLCRHCCELKGALISRSRARLRYTARHRRRGGSFSCHRVSFVSQ